MRWVFSGVMSNPMVWLVLSTPGLDMVCKEAERFLMSQQWMEESFLAPLYTKLPHFEN